MSFLSETVANAVELEKRKKEDSFYESAESTDNQQGLITSANNQALAERQAPSATGSTYDGIVSQPYFKDQPNLGTDRGAGAIKDALMSPPSVSDQEPPRVGRAGTNMQIDPNTGTVSGQMNRLLDQGSPYITAAEQNAIRGMASRGLQNSSIAAGAGRLAAYQAALPIAQADATAYNQAALANIQANTQLGIADLDAATRVLGIEMDNDNKMLLQKMIEDNKRALQSDASISTSFSNTMNSIAQVYQNTEMSGSAQQAAARWFISSFKSYVEFQDVTGGSNYASQFDWGAWDVTEGEDDPKLLEPFGVTGVEGESREFGSNTYSWNESGGRWVKQKREVDFSNQNEHNEGNQ